MVLTLLRVCSQPPSDRRTTTWVHENPHSLRAIPLSHQLAQEHQLIEELDVRSGSQGVLPAIRNQSTALKSYQKHALVHGRSPASGQKLPDTVQWNRQVDHSNHGCRLQNHQTHTTCCFLENAMMPVQLLDANLPALVE